MSAIHSLGRQFGFTHTAAVGGYDDMVEAEGKLGHVLSSTKAPLDILEGHHISVTPYMSHPAHAGEYDKASRTVRIHPEVIDHEQGLLHELGHLHSARMGNAHAEYDTPQRQAAEEHYAEEFARRHAAPR